jgi:hypothetical protein
VVRELHTSVICNLATMGHTTYSSKVYNLTILDIQLSRVVHVGVEEFIQRLGCCLDFSPYALSGASGFTGVNGG